MMEQALYFMIMGPGGLREVTLDAQQPIWLGRDESCEIPLPAQSVSRRHTSVVLRTEGLRITDASTNGTDIDGQPLRRGSRLLPTGRATLRISTFEVRVAKREAIPTAQPRDATKPATRANGAAIPAAVASNAPGSSIAARRRIHSQLLENLDLPSLDRSTMDVTAMRPKVLAALRRIVTESGNETPTPDARQALVHELADEVLGLGPLERLLADPEVSEIMVVDPHTIFAERCGRMELTGLRFTDDDRCAP